MRSRTTKSILLNCLACIALSAVPGVVSANMILGDNVELGDSLMTLQAKLEGFCESVNVISVDRPQFPLARSSEQHLICSAYSGNDVTLEKAAFTIADGQLVHVEMTRIEIDAVRNQLGPLSANYVDMENYNSASHWLNAAQESLIWLSPEGLHLNLFVWHNKFLDDEAYAYERADIAIPEIVDFDSPLALQETLLEELCSPLLVETEDESWLPNSPAVQVQANCFNYSFAGFERKFELVYGDGKLEVIWVLTSKPEEQRIRELLVDAWGSPEIENEIWEVFNEGRVALRKDVPEVLMLSDEMVPFFREAFRGGGGL